MSIDMFPDSFVQYMADRAGLPLDRNYTDEEVKALGRPFVARYLPDITLELRGQLLRPNLHHNANMTRAEFRPGVCCEHRWATQTLFDGVTPVCWTDPGAEVCVRCGATCTRDREGKIDWYDAEGGAPDVY